MAADVLSSPIQNAPVFAKLYQGYVVRVISQTKSFFRIEFLTQDGSVREGWVEKSAVTLDPPPRKTTVTSAIVGPEEGGGSSSGEDGLRWSSEKGDHSVRLLFSPIFNVYRYGATQFRIGASFDFPISPRWSLGFPASYAFASGFWSLQGGGQVSYDVKKWKRSTLYSRMGGLFERFSGKGRSFLAGTVDLGLGIRYRFEKYFWLGVEPISAEVMVFGTENIPWNIRGQTLVELRSEW